MKVFHKTEVNLVPIEEWRGGTKYSSYGAYVTIETDDEGLLQAILDAVLQVEESLRGA